MEQAPLPPIPTPASQRWREFRIRIMPVFVFMLSVAGLGYLWNNYVAPSGIVGSVESISSMVTSMADGQVLSLSVDRYEPVKLGQVIGSQSRMEPELIAATIASITADLEVLRAQYILRLNGSEQQYQQVRLTMFEQQVLLAGSRMNFIQASNEFGRVAELYNQSLKLESATAYDLAKAKKDSLQAEIEERTKLIKEMEEVLPRLRAMDSSSTTNDPVTRAIEAKRAELELATKPVPLRAPIDGVITLINKRPGERIIKGDPILTISSQNSERILAYVRQPMNTAPTANDTVLIRTRTFKRLSGEGKILKVGASLESIPPMLLSPDGKRLESGLPVIISLPASLRGKVSPGEFLDMSIKALTK
ncbi:MAG TPA: HlyD family efflux transporter periplasmic adaptor subunit [Verrucomicrobiae bacterium]